MALLLNEIEWEQPMLPAVSDPEWEAEVKKRGGFVTQADKLIAPNRCLRETWLRMTTYQPEEIPRRLYTLGALVTSQENSCRYCYGANRAFLKFLGYSESFITSIERDLRAAELDEKQHEFVGFCRNLARSRPRPAKADRERLIALGYSPRAVNEMAFLIVGGCFSNRVGVLLACPPEQALERMATGLLGTVMGLMAPITTMLMNRKRGSSQSQEFAPEELAAGPFGPVVATLAGLPAAAIMKSAIDGTFASNTLSRPAKALMFAIVARTLDCRHTEPEARKLLRSEGVGDAEVETALQTLQSSRLSPTEAALLPWTRDTVYYQTPAIQKRTRALAAEVGSAALLEAIGVAALANATVRLAMLLE